MYLRMLGFEDQCLFSGKHGIVFLRHCILAGFLHVVLTNLVAWMRKHSGISVRSMASFGRNIATTW